MPLPPSPVPLKLGSRADRFHMLKNLGEVLEGLLARHLATTRQKKIQETLEEHIPIEHATRSLRRSPKVERLQQAYREQRLARYEQVVALRNLGMSQAAIAKRVGMGQSTVGNWLAAGAYPETTRGPYVSRLDPICPICFSGGSRGATIWFASIKNWWREGTKGPMPACVITWFGGFQKARRTQQKGTNCLQRLSPLGKQPSCSSVDLNN